MQLAVLAIRIYYDPYKTPMADLKMVDGACETIEWTNVEQCEKFLSYINGYTLIYDERDKKDWWELL